MQLSTLVSHLQPSATIAAAAKAKELVARGINVLDFTLGEPDFLTPAHIREAARQAMDAGHTHYTPAAGIPQLKQAICDAFHREFGIRYKPTEIVVSNGAKHSIHNVLTTLCNPGDEVIVPTPYWVSYSALVELAGATPVLVPTTEETGFCLHPDQLEAAITPRTKLLMLNNPCNPTGAAYPVDLLQGLADVAMKRKLLVMSDEIYGKLTYPGHEFRTFVSFGDALRDQSIIVTGVSKSYAMTGWRIGWTMAPEGLTKGMTSLQSQQTSNPCSVSQYAAIAALSGPQDCVNEMRLEFEKRREYVVRTLREIPDITFADPGGAFYAFFNVSRYFGRELPGNTRVDNATDFCSVLLEQAHVALVTGDAFGAPGYVRLSFATGQEVIEAGIAALRNFLAAAK